MEYTKTALRVYMAAMFLMGIQMSCQMTFNALGKAVESIVVAVMRKFVLLIPLIYLVPQIMKGNETMASIWLNYRRYHCSDIYSHPVCGTV